VLSEEEFSPGEIHGAASLLLDAAALRERAAAKMREEPLYFVDDPSGIFKK
jgi:hypothetical protein